MVPQYSRPTSGFFHKFPAKTMQQPNTTNQAQPALWKLHRRKKVFFITPDRCIITITTSPAAECRSSRTSTIAFKRRIRLLPTITSLDSPNMHYFKPINSEVLMNRSERYGYPLGLTELENIANAPDDLSPADEVAASDQTDQFSYLEEHAGALWPGKYNLPPGWNDIIRAIDDRKIYTIEQLRFTTYTIPLDHANPTGNLPQHKAHVSFVMDQIVPPMSNLFGPETNRMVCIVVTMEDVLEQYIAAYRSLVKGGWNYFELPRLMLYDGSWTDEIADVVVLDAVWETNEETRDSLQMVLEYSATKACLLVQNGPDWDSWVEEGKVEWPAAEMLDALELHWATHPSVSRINGELVTQVRYFEEYIVPRLEQKYGAAAVGKACRITCTDNLDKVRTLIPKAFRGRLQQMRYALTAFEWEHVYACAAEQIERTLTKLRGEYAVLHAKLDWYKRNSLCWLKQIHLTATIDNFLALMSVPTHLESFFRDGFPTPQIFERWYELLVGHDCMSDPHNNHNAALALLEVISHMGNKTNMKVADVMAHVRSAELDRTLVMVNENDPELDEDPAVTEHDTKLMAAMSTTNTMLSSPLRLFQAFVSINAINATPFDIGAADLAYPTLMTGESSISGGVIHVGGPVVDNPLGFLTNASKLLDNGQRDKISLVVDKTKEKKGRVSMARLRQAKGRAAMKNASPRL
ncbi:hypothetical protein LTR56_001598 [Elasticomyces elasticus]|nr:hypothetical protein LTR56_001598 [Elasticomyces elasticus]